MAQVWEDEDYGKVASTFSTRQDVKKSICDDAETVVVDHAVLFSTYTCARYIIFTGIYVLMVKFPQV